MKASFIIAITTLLLLAACGQAEVNAEARPFKLGIIAPLSGPNAWIGDFVTNALNMAIEEVNAQSGVNGQPIKVVLEDADNPAKASTAANKLISQDGVDIIYAVTTPVVASASAVADQYGIPLFGFTSVQTYAKKNTWVFSDLRDTIQECELLSKAALENGHTKLAFLGNDADFSQECLETFQKDFVGGGGTLVANEMKVSNDPDARTTIIKFKNAKPDGVILVCWPPDCNIIYRQMLELQYTPQFYLPIGTALSSNAIAVKDLDKNALLAGAYASDQGINPDKPSPEFAAFIKRISQRMSNRTTPHADAAVAYDNLHEIAIAANKCPGLGKDCIRDKLAETDYTGVAGHIAFNGKHFGARPARVVRYDAGKWVEP